MKRIAKDRERGIYRLAAYLVFIALSLLPIFYLFAAEYDEERYLQILKDLRLQGMLASTLGIAAGACALSTILGLAFAVLLERTDLPYKKQIRALLFISLLIPPYITAISWLMFLGRSVDFSEPPAREGEITFANLLKVPWYLPQRIDPYNIWWAMFLIAMSYFPLVTLVSSYALRNIDPGMEESARLARSPLTVLRKITLPMIFPQIAAGALLVFVFAMTELDIPSVLRMFTLIMEVFLQASGFFDLKQATAVSIPLTLVAALIAIAIPLLLGKRSFLSTPNKERKHPVIKLGPAGKAAVLLFTSFILLLSAGVPLGTLAAMSRFKFMDALSSDGWPIVNTIIISSLASLAMAALGFFIAYFAEKKAAPLIIFPLAVPSALIGIGIITVWNRDLTGFIYGGPLILVLGYTARFLPYVVKTIEPFINQINPSLEEAARVGGSSLVGTMKSIVLPLARPGILSALAVGFMLCTRELTLSIMLTPPGFQTLSNRIFTLYHYGDTEKTACLSLMLIAIVASPLIIYGIINKARWSRSKRRN